VERYAGADLRMDFATPHTASAEERIQELTAQLELINSELDSIYYSVSHDLRAAIRGIAACSKVVIEDYAAGLNEDAKRWLAHIHQDSVQLDQFTEALLELSRVSRATLNPKALDLTAMAREIAADLAAKAPERTVNFQIGERLTAWGDAALVRILMQHLLENAWKFSKLRSDARIEVDSSQSDSDRGAFYVRDNGAGFDMAHMDRLFVAFQRLHRDRDFSGNGVGLATVRRIVHRHGGKAWAVGHPGLGATFFFTLGRR
jgi:light-regulated signal transduction histidine kinase (bacteriophytochrome)